MGAGRPFRAAHGHSNVRAGKPSPTYRSWQAMQARCTRQDHPHYGSYGGRGITICERWRSFENFLADMGERPAGKTLDRIDNDGNYEPGNCRWASMREQRNNSRQNHWIEFGGERKTLTEWAIERGLRPGTLKERLRKGWSIVRALSAPVRPRGHDARAEDAAEARAEAAREARRLGIDRWDW